MKACCKDLFRALRPMMFSLVVSLYRLLIPFRLLSVYRIADTSFSTLFKRPIPEKVCPIWVFLVEDVLLFFCQVVRIVGEQIKDFLFVESEQVFAYTFNVVYPIDCVAFVFLIKVVFCHLLLCLCIMQRYVFWGKPG